MNNKYTYHNMWPDFAFDNNLKGQMSRVLKPLEPLYDEIQIYSLFPARPPQSSQLRGPFGLRRNNQGKKILKVQYSGESWFMNPQFFDLNFIPSAPYQPPYQSAKVIPYLFATEKKDFLSSRSEFLSLSDAEIMRTKNKFCCFIASNSVGFRNQLYQYINDIKKVDCYGKLFNNGPPIQHRWWTREYFNFLQPHKFMLVCENKIQDWYCTEKPICALAGGTVPIYCGSDKLFNYINRDSVIYLPDTSMVSLEAAKREIILLDNNDALYLKKLRTPFLAKDDWDIDYIQQVKQLFNV